MEVVQNGGKSQLAESFQVQGLAKLFAVIEL